ncbi:hypothetical protein CLV78_105233 [Aliiruegeria haliotis]|uniref:Uncharacterized protein n=1 Tax=Aliiruegeria haliotis TaxID=1280846 RepID=A0A2T0RPR2_9RHOB|nr:hypothetical protein CLV78_105233 [Aliiruegeria haliotis]
MVRANLPMTLSILPGECPHGPRCHAAPDPPSRRRGAPGDRKRLLGRLAGAGSGVGWLQPPWRSKGTGTPAQSDGMQLPRPGRERDVGRVPPPMKQATVWQRLSTVRSACVVGMSRPTNQRRLKRGRDPSDKRRTSRRNCIKPAPMAVTATPVLSAKPSLGGARGSTCCVKQKRKVSRPQSRPLPNPQALSTASTTPYDTSFPRIETTPVPTRSLAATALTAHGFNVLLGLSSPAGPHFLATGLSTGHRRGPATLNRCRLLPAPDCRVDPNIDAWTGPFATGHTCTTLANSSGHIERGIWRSLCALTRAWRTRRLRPNAGSGIAAFERTGATKMNVRSLVAMAALASFWFIPAEAQQQEGGFFSQFVDEQDGYLDASDFLD